MDLSRTSSGLSHCSHLLTPALAFAHPTKRSSSSFKGFDLSSSLIPRNIKLTLHCNGLKQRNTLAKRFSAIGEPRTMQTNRGLLRVFENEDELANNLADYIASLSEATVNRRGVFTVVLSGGSLIRSLRNLTEPPYARKINWENWHLFWVDERVVARNHPDSNYKLAWDGLLSKVPIEENHVYSIDDTLSAKDAAENYENVLHQLVKTGVIESTTENFPAFDLILLGMGPDGHVASLFPGHPLLNEKKRWITFLNDSPKPPPERITFTMPVINSAANVCLVVTGANKSEPLKKVFSDHSDELLLPVQMVLPKDGNFTCFADQASTALIST